MVAGPSRLRIYTAGAMRDDGEYAEWRRSVEDDIDELVFYHPEGFKHEHSGFTLDGAVSEDMTAIRAADGLVAYISETPQIGTVTEVLHAVNNDTPTLVLFNHGRGELLDGAITADEDDYEYQELRYPAEVEPIGIRGHAQSHWFLINYLVGDCEPRSVNTNEVEGELPKEIDKWEGIREGTVMAIPSEEDISAAVYNWIESEFGVGVTSTM